jgi:hypothetical protein
MINQHSNLVPIEDLFQIQEGSRVRVIGFIVKESPDKLFIQGLSGVKVSLNMTENIIIPVSGSSYLVLGEYRDSTIFCKILKEVKFKKYNVSYYLKNLISFKNVDIKPD